MMKVSIIKKIHAKFKTWDNLLNEILGGYATGSQEKDPQRFI